jgi:hypothetical protein
MAGVRGVYRSHAGGRADGRTDWMADATIALILIAFPADVGN